MTMTAEARRALLTEAFAAGRAFREVDESLLSANDGEADRLRALKQHYHDTISVLLREYMRELPRPALTKDPYTSEVVHHSIDVEGLDGFWWNHDGVARPREEGLPRTWFALTGAVRLQGEVARAPFLCKPGPEVPYVLPRLLDHKGVTAVLSSVRVGEHQGYAIAYFAKPMAWQLPRVDTWGADHFWYVTKDGEWAWDETPLVEEDMDFDLEPWIESGKLRWIAPDDARATLHKTLAGCPYLDLPGREAILRIEEGRVWTRQEVP